MPRPRAAARARQRSSISLKVVRPYISGSRTPKRLRLGPFSTKTVGKAPSRPQMRRPYYPCRHAQARGWPVFPARAGRRAATPLNRAPIAAACRAVTARSVDVLVIAPVAGERGEMRFCRIGGHCAFAGGDIDEGALGEPCPQRCRLFEQAMLNINLVRLVARKRGVETGQEPVAVIILEFGLEQEIGGPALIAEHEPVAGARAKRPALLQKGAERGEPGAGADHDDRRVDPGGKAKPGGAVDKD